MGTIVNRADANGTYTNPGAPVYLVLGASGATQEETFVEPQPDWSTVRMISRMTVTAATSLHLDFMDMNGSFTLLRT